MLAGVGYEHLYSQCVAGGVIPWAPTRKVEGEAGCAAEVRLAHGTLMAEDLNISEVYWERRPVMEGSFLICTVMFL